LFLYKERKVTDKQIYQFCIIIDGGRMKRILAIGIILLFIGSVSSTGFDVREQSTIAPIDGKILYVGGSGPGNYTKIQEAINDSSDGDTVFVYNDSSPYYENIEIDKSINLTGEDKNTTIIDGNYSYDPGIKINANKTKITEFTIQNSGINVSMAGIVIRSNHSTIMRNIVNSNSNYGNGIILQRNSHNNLIKENNISTNRDGIDFYSNSNYNRIEGNIISNNQNGSNIWCSNNNKITNNIIKNNGRGIYLSYESNNNIINNNIISNNSIGINLYDSCIKNIILDNYFSNDGLWIWKSYQNTVVNNTVNGKPLVYMENESDKTIDDAGQVILINCNNITVKNQELSNTTVGIQLLNTKNCLIHSNNIISNKRNGIYLYRSSNTTVKCNNISLNHGSAISFYKSEYNTIMNNNISLNDGRGISSYESDYNTIIGNNISLNKGGMHCGSNSVITDNSISSNSGIGINLRWSCYNNIITDNTICSNKDDGISLDESNNNNITSNNIMNNGKGITLRESNRNIMIGNSFYNNGFHLLRSYKNTVLKNTVNDKPIVYLEDKYNIEIDYAGHVLLVNCSNITVKNQDLSNTSAGILLSGSKNCFISGNNISNNKVGIIFYYSIGNTISGNAIISNNYGMQLGLYSSTNTVINNSISLNNRGIELSVFNNGIIQGNNISSNYGYGMYLQYSSRNKILGNNIRLNHGPGVSISNSKSYNNIIAGNSISSNSGDGIRIDSHFNNISGNAIFSNNKNGIYFCYVHDNTIIGNNITSNNDYGIYLFRSTFNTIKLNDIKLNNDYGIYLFTHSNDNSIYHNNFINNTKNAYDEDKNTWDDGYPSGGNYWSDYTGEDKDGDGIGDTPYNISGGDNKDRYPLIESYSFPPIAKFIWTPLLPDPNETILFNASESIDYDGIIILYEWDWDNDGEYDENHTNYMATHSWSEYGYYPVTLRITDNDNLTDNITKTVRVGNQPPYEPSNPYPPDGAINVSDSGISWTGGDPDPDDIVTYDVYFGKSSPPPLVVVNLSITAYELGVIDFNTTYYWQIVAWDNWGASTAGPIWSFTTISASLELSIVRPVEKSFYLQNMHLFSLPRNTIIVGYIDIIGNVTSNIGVEKVEFYIDDNLKSTIINIPYNWTWDDRVFFRHKIKVIAYDNVGNKATKEMKVWKFL